MKVHVVVENIVGEPSLKLVTTRITKAFDMFRRLMIESDLETLTEAEIKKAFDAGEYDFGDCCGVWYWHEEVEE